MDVAHFIDCSIISTETVTLNQWLPIYTEFPFPFLCFSQSLSLYIARNEYKRLPTQVGRGRLGSTRPRTYVTDRSGTNQTSGTLSSSSLQAKNVELECDNLGY